MAVKRVKVEQLRLGMYIHDLNCGWLNHGFIRSRFLLQQPSEILKIKNLGLSEIFIDTSRGDDVAEIFAPSETTTLPPAKTDESLDRRLMAPASEGATLPPAQRSQMEEAGAAKAILVEATGVVDGLLQDVRFGKQLDPAKARPLVRSVFDSITRNPGALISLSRIKDADHYTFQHSVSICALMISFSHALGLDRATVEEAGLGGLLHDVGKMKIPMEVLNKPGRLTEEEFTVMKSHAPLSRDLLTGVAGISEMVIKIAGEHHERVGGGGYPNGMAGEGISQIGRMTAIVDVYDALTSNRVYHKGKEPTEVLKILLGLGGTHLDEDLVQHFIRTLGIYPVGSLVQLSGGRLAVVVDQGEDLLRPTVRLVYDTKLKVLLPPRDLSLNRSTEEIVDFEEPLDWGLDPASFL